MVLMRYTPDERVQLRFDYLRSRWPVDVNAWLTMAMQRIGDRFEIAGAYPIDDVGLKGIAEDAERWREGADLWLSMCGFGGRPPGKGRERHVSAISSLWADVDVKAFKGQPQPAEMTNIMKDLGDMRPSQLLWSGHGLQPVWFLDHSYDLNDHAADPAELASVQGKFREVSSRWGTLIGELLGVKLDNVSNLDRVMRVPHTYNLKGGQRASVYTIWNDTDRRFKLGDLVQYLDVKGVKTNASGGATCSAVDAAAAFARQGSLLEAEASTVAERLLSKYTAIAADRKEGDRVGHDWTGFLLAQQLNDHYVPRETAEEVLDRYREACRFLPGARPEDPFPRTWPHQKVNSAYGYPPRGPASAPADTSLRVAFGRDTDFINAKRLSERFKEDLRWATKDEWLVWNGRCWAPDTFKRRFGIVAALADAIRTEATEADDVSADQRKVLVRHANRLEMLGGINSTLRLGEADMAVDPVQLDQAADLFNLPNGTLDLRTFQLRGAERSDLITRMCPTEYVPGAWSETWEKFVAECCGSDVEKLEWLQRYCGYLLTGSTAEDLILVVHGPTRTGKSTFVSTLAAALGDVAAGGYATVVSADALSQGSHTNEEQVLDKVFGSRLVTMSEASRGSRLADTFLKRLAGGDLVHARALYQKPYSYRPTCKVVVSTNYVPHSMDPAIHRRLRLFPFVNVVEHVDMGLRERLVGSADTHRAVLAWCVEGCKMWRKEGLGEPEFLREELKGYVEDSDPLLTFIDDCLVRGEKSMIGPRDLFQLYVAWATENVQRPLKKLAFETMMSERGFRKQRFGGQWTWMGLGLPEAPVDATRLI